MSPKHADADSVATEISHRIAALSAIRTQPLRALAREYSAALRREPAQKVIDVALQLLKHRSFAHRMIAYELVHHHRDALARVGKRELALLGRGLASWGDVDTFACYIAGPAWTQGQIDDGIIAQWAQAPDRWRRRAAVVSTVPLCRSDKLSSATHERILRVFDLVIDDRDPMVVKALSWGLRELAKWSPQTARQYLAAHGSRLAALVRREVNNKLATGLKNPGKAPGKTRKDGLTVRGSRGVK